MENLNPTKHWWLLITRGLLYISIGICLFLFADNFSSSSARLIAGLLLAAGVLGLAYTFGNVRTDRNYIWELLRSLSDVAFGIALFASAKQDTDGFLSTLSFWAMVYAFIQVVQAMYSFMQSGVGSNISLSGKLIYFLGVVVSGGLSYTLLMRPNGLDSSLGLIGLFPIVLGVIITVLAVQQKRHASLANNPPKPY